MAKKKVVEAVVEAASTEPTVLKTFESGYNVEYVVPGSCTYLKDGCVNMTIKMEHWPDEIPFAASPQDVMEHGRWLHEQALSGAFGEIAEWQKPLPTVQDLQEELDKIWPDVVLGIATEEELSLAKNLRIQIKAMSE